MLQAVCNPPGKGGSLVGTGFVPTWGCMLFAPTQAGRDVLGGHYPTLAQGPSCVPWYCWL